MSRTKETDPVVTTLEIWGEKLPVTISVSGTMHWFCAEWQGKEYQAQNLEGLEKQIKAVKRAKRTPWEVPVLVRQHGKLVTCYLMGRHAGTGKFLLRGPDRWNENKIVTAQVDGYGRQYYKPGTPEEEFTALVAALRAAEEAKSEFDKKWAVKLTDLARPFDQKAHEAEAADAPLPEGEDMPEPLSEAQSVKAMGGNFEDGDPNDSGD